MASIDIRSERDDAITEIVFAESEHRNGYSQAHQIRAYYGFMTINDVDKYVLINSKQHARDLIKALEKAIELGWVK